MHTVYQREEHPEYPMRSNNPHFFKENRQVRPSKSNTTLPQSTTNWGVT